VIRSASRPNSTGNLGPSRQAARADEEGAPHTPSRPARRMPGRSGQEATAWPRKRQVPGGALK